MRAAENQDASKSILTSSAHDTTKSRLLNALAWELKFSNPAEAEALADKAMVLAKRYGLNREISNSFKSKAHTSLSKNEYFKTILLYDSAIYYAQKTKDKSLIAQCLNKKAGAFGDLGDFDKAIEYYSQGLALAKQINNTQLLGVFYNNLADAYQNTGRNTALVQYYYKLALDNSMKSENWAAAGLNSSNLAKEYSANKLINEAKKEIQRTESLIKKTPDGTYLRAATLKEIASVYDDLGDYSTAGMYAKRAYDILDSLKMPINLLRPLEVLTSVAIKDNKIGKAEKYAQELLQLAITTHSKVYIKEGYRYLAQIAKSKGDYKKTSEYLEKYKSWSDSVFRIEREKSISKTELETALAKQRFEVMYGAKLKNIENEKLLNNNRLLTVGIVLTSIALAILLILGLWLNKSIQKSKILNADLLKKNEMIRNHILEKDTLIHEIHHRVKNNLTMLQSLFYLQAKSSKDEAVKQITNESQSRLLSMALVHQHLYDNNAEGSLDLVKFFKELVHDIADTFIRDEEKTIRIQVTGEETSVGVKLAVPLGLMLNELITNSIKYAFINVEEGEIHVSISQNSQGLSIQYTDNGPGLTEDFNFQKAGFGFRILQLLSKQIKAEFNHSRLNNHSTFTLNIPL